MDPTRAELASWEDQGEFARNCVHAITNTAERLGVDPLALAEVCRDGWFLEFGLLAAKTRIENTDPDWPPCQDWLKRFASLTRRAAASEGGEG